MPSADNDYDLLPSILDRLLDDDPRASHEPPATRFYSLGELKQAVVRDLEALLNTRQEALQELPPEFVEVRQSLLVYGLPDFTTLSLANFQDRSRIRRALEHVIATFEPRLERVRVSIEDPRHLDQALRFRVEAMLRMEPSPVAVTFDAALLKTQEYTVQGND